MRRMEPTWIAALVLISPASRWPRSAFAKTGVITIDGQVGGKQKPTFDKKKFKPTNIKIDTTTADADDPSALPPKVNQSVVKFDSKDIRFDHTAVPGCDPSQIATATTEDAIAACGDAKVGTGEAVVNLPFGVGGVRQDFPAVVTAFNRSRRERTSCCIRGSLRCRRRQC